MSEEPTLFLQLTQREAYLVALGLSKLGGGRQVEALATKIIQVGLEQNFFDESWMEKYEID